MTDKENRVFKGETDHPVENRVFTKKHKGRHDLIYCGLQPRIKWLKPPTPNNIIGKIITKIFYKSRYNAILNPLDTPNRNGRIYSADAISDAIKNMGRLGYCQIVGEDDEENNDEDIEFYTNSES